MKFTFAVPRSLPGHDARALFVDASDVAATDVGTGLEARALWGRAGFTGKAEQVLVVPPAEPSAPVTYLVGIGKANGGPGDRTDLRVRRAAAALARSLKKHDAIAVELTGGLAGADPGERAQLAAAVAEGLTLGGYQFTTYKARSDPEAQVRVLLGGGGGKRVAEAMEEGRASARAVLFARDLVNAPGGELTPDAFAGLAAKAALDHGFSIQVLDEKKLTRLGYHGLLGVNKGSKHPPRFVTLGYRPAATKAKANAKARGKLALVGKGITFDSGGLSIKTATGMMTMKDDMGGAAAVLAAFTRFAEAGVQCDVTGYLPLTDNMLGPDAIRPGDVIRYRNGTSVEVLNTDAEGRLVLADALLSACQDGHDAILDVATLTGAVEVALGPRIAGLMGNNEPWLVQVEAAARRAGERAWRLPLPADERSRLDSDVADLRNIGKGSGGGALIAGLFLQEFVADHAWAHLDIAGTAWTEDPRGEASKGGTGYAVRTIVELARAFQAPAAGAAASA